MTRIIRRRLLSKIFSTSRPILPTSNALLDRKASSLPISAVLGVDTSNSVLLERQVTLSNHTGFLGRKLLGIIFRF